MKRKRPTIKTAGRPGKKIQVGSRVRIKEEPRSEKAAASAEVTKEEVKKRFIALCSEPQFKSGISNTILKTKFIDQHEYLMVAEIINDLLRDSRIQMSRAGADNELYYTLLSANVALKYKGLDAQAKMVLQIIEEVGNNGIWTKDIRMKTNIQQQALNKIFKMLEQRRLIKPVKSVTAKAKKLYMLYELTPSKELTGGVWYSGLEFDHEFIAELRTFVHHCVRRLNSGQGATITEIKAKMSQAKVSRVELSDEEVKQLVMTMVYDYHVEEGPETEEGEIKYLPARRVTTMCNFKWWDANSPDFHFRKIRFEDGVTLQPHEPHHHTA